MQASSFRSIISSFTNVYTSSQPHSEARHKIATVIRGITRSWLNDIAAGRIDNDSSVPDSIIAWLDEIAPMPVLPPAPVLLPPANVPEPVKEPESVKVPERVDVVVKEKKPKKVKVDSEALIAAFEQMFLTQGNMMAFMENEEVQIFLAGASKEASQLHHLRLENGIILLDKPTEFTFPLYIRRIAAIINKLLRARDDKIFQTLASMVPGIVDLYCHSFVSICIQCNEEMLDYIFSMLTKQCNLDAPKIRDLYATLACELHAFALDNKRDRLFPNITRFWAKIDPLQISGKKRKLSLSESSDDDDVSDASDKDDMNADIANRLQAPGIREWIADHYKLASNGGETSQLDLCKHCFAAGKVTGTKRTTRMGNYAIQAIPGVKREKRGKFTWLNIEPK